LDVQRNARFYGHSTPSVALGASIWLESVRMTATVHVYTSYGFTIAAEGRQRWTHADSRDMSIKQLESDKVQKLFEITNEYVTLAYTVKGDIASVDKSFDLTVELKRQVDKLRSGKFKKCRGLVEALAKYTELAILEARRQGRLASLPAAEVTIVGYFKGRPYCMEVQFRRSSFPSGHTYRVVEHEVKPGFCIMSGSDVVKSLVELDHPLVEDFNSILDKKTSLDTANKFVTGYILACCSDWALELDPNSIYNGGHIHVATIVPAQSLKSRISRILCSTPKPMTGFQWVIPPLAELPLKPRESSV
jgi:hypothetical protein